MTLDNWKAQITAKGITSNEAVILLNEAMEQIAHLRAERERLQAEIEVLKAIADATIISWKLTANEDASRRKALIAEIDRLRSALKVIANHNAERGTALETVVLFAGMTLEKGGK